MWNHKEETTKGTKNTRTWESQDSPDSLKSRELPESGTHLRILHHKNEISINNNNQRILLCQLTGFPCLYLTRDEAELQEPEEPES